MPIRVEFQGQAHEFPDGTPDEAIAAALQGTIQAPEPDAMEQKFPGLRTLAAEQDAKVRVATPRSMAAAAGFAAGPAVIPGAIAAGGAAYLGHRLLGKDRDEAAGEGMTEGLSSALFGGITKIPAGLRKVARRAVKGGLKIDRGYLEKMATARKQGLMGAEEEVVDTVLDTRINPATAKGYDKLQARINTKADARNAKIQAAPDVPVAKSGAATNQILNRRLSSELDATDPGGAGATREVMRGLAANPRYGANATGQLPDLTPQELARRVAADNADLRGMFGKEQAPGLEAIKDVRGLNARMLDRAAGTKAESQELKRLIDLRNVANVARRRSEARDVVGITDLISLSAGRPEVLGVTTAMRPAVQTGLGLGLDRLRSMVPLPSHAVRGEREMIQALIAQLLGSPHDPE